MLDTTSNYATLNPENEGVIFSGEPKLREYLVSSVQMFDYREVSTKQISCHDSINLNLKFQGLFSGKRLLFVFENLVTFYVTSAYIPTLIMLVIGCSTFWFPLQDFQDRIMVAITSLLVEASFFTQVSILVQYSVNLDTIL